MSPQLCRRCTHADHFDLSPLFRSTIGFDRMSRLLDAAMRRRRQRRPTRL